MSKQIFLMQPVEVLEETMVEQVSLSQPMKGTTAERMFTLQPTEDSTPEQVDMS